jgi:hypothetical protein
MLTHRISLALCMVALAVAQSASANETSSPATLDATVKLTGGVMAAGVGYRWGRGTLTYQGQEYGFCVHGLSIGDVGAVKLSAQGAVYNLKSPDDFSGKYFTLSGGFAIARGESGALLKNKQGVMIELETLETGLRFDIAAGGLKITMAGQRGCKAK